MNVNFIIVTQKLFCMMEFHLIIYKFLIISAGGGINKFIFITLLILSPYVADTYYNHLLMSVSYLFLVYLIFSFWAGRGGPYSQ